MAGLRSNIVDEPEVASPRRGDDAWGAAVQWLTAVTGVAAPNGAVQEWLMSGVLLCELINCIREGAVPKVSASPMPFKQMENIGNYINACRQLGVPQQDLFMTVDLYEAKNLGAVVQNIHSLGRVAQRIGFEGPVLGARLSQRNERKFSEQQLALARAMPARWTNQGNTLTCAAAASAAPSAEAVEVEEANAAATPGITAAEAEVVEAEVSAVDIESSATLPVV